MTNNFDKIRPYNDDETVEAVKRMAESPAINNISKFIDPNLDPKDLIKLLNTINGVNDFQERVLSKIVQKVVDDTTEGLEVSGLENVSSDKCYLIISNHRDIILDSAFLQIILLNDKQFTTEITVGDNLISSPFVKDLMKSNKMVTVERGGTVKEKYFSSLNLSKYIRHSVSTNTSSIWISQRNGRTKDGYDTTEQGLLKMFEMSGSKDFVKDFTELSILPLSISYEYESCDFFKAKELYISKSNKYVKSPNEDMQSMLTGIIQPKGKVHYSFGKPISIEEIKRCSLLDKNEKYLELASIIDKRIRGNFTLVENNYIAADLLEKLKGLNGSKKILDELSSLEYKNNENYTIDKFTFFKNYMKNGLAKILEENPTFNSKELATIYLNIYANPLKY